MTEITTVPVVTPASIEQEAATIKPTVTTEAPEAPPAEQNAAPAAEEAPKADDGKLKPRGMSKAYATLKEKEAALAERERIIAEREQKSAIESIKPEDLKNTPSKVLEKLGMSFEELAQAVIKEGQAPGLEDIVVEMGKKIDNLEKTQEEKDKAEEEKVEKERQNYIDRAVENYKVELGKHIESQPETYELIIANEAQGLVFDTVEAYYLKNQKICSMEDACKATENFLLERAKKLLGLKKLAVKVEEKKPVSQTLTNGDSSFSKPTTSAIPAHLPKEQRLKMAADLLKFN